MKMIGLTLAHFGLVKALLAWSAPATDGGLDALAPKLATTPEAHRAIARYYGNKAVEATAEAGRHRAMARDYGETNLTRKRIMQEHCERLVNEYEALAKQYQDMAIEHTEMAKQ